MKETRKQKIERMMKVYKCSYEEALQLILDDEETDKGKLHEWNLTKAQEREMRKYRQADREKPLPSEKPKEKVKRERKEDPNKRLIISTIAEMLKNSDFSKNVEVVRVEGEIQFTVGERKFKIVLSAPRK